MRIIIASKTRTWLAFAPQPQSRAQSWCMSWSRMSRTQARWAEPRWSRPNPHLENFGAKMQGSPANRFYTMWQGGRIPTTPCSKCEHDAIYHGQKRAVALQYQTLLFFDCQLSCLFKSRGLARCGATWLSLRDSFVVLIHNHGVANILYWSTQNHVSIRSVIFCSSRTGIGSG